MTDRRFTDEEVALILREASEVQEGGRPGGVEGGLTLSQLKEIAVEVGLDPKNIEMAASRLAAYRNPAAVPVLGTPVAPQFQRDVPGELSREDFAELLSTIRTVLGRRGITAVELNALEWKAQDYFGGRYVSVVPGNGKTRVRVFGNFRDGMMTVGLVGGMAVTTLVAGVLAALGLQDVVGAGILPISILVSVLPALGFWRWKYRKETQVMADLAEALDDHAVELIAKRTGPPSDD